MIVALPILLLATILNFGRFRDVLYPGFIQAVVWTVMLAAYSLNSDLLLPLSNEVLRLVTAGVILFSAGCLLATRSARPGRLRIDPDGSDSAVRYRSLLFWIPVLGIAPFIAKAAMLAADGPFDSFYRNLRDATSNAEDQSAGGSFGLLAYLLPISFVSLAIQVLFRSYRSTPRRFLLSLAATLLYAFFATGRTYIVLLGVVCAGVLVTCRRVSPWKVLGMGSAVGSVVFMALGILAAKGGSAEGGRIEIDPSSLWDLFITYSLGSLPAFDTFMQVHTDWSLGERTLRTVYAVLAQMGFDVPVQPLVQPYVFVPFPTNVYTVFQPYYADFGLPGALLFPLAAGYLHGKVYERAAGGHPFWILIFAYSLYPMLLQFFQDQYISVLSMWIQFLAFSIPAFFSFRLRSGPIEQPSGDIPSLRRGYA